MSYLVILGLVILWSSQLQATSNRCDSPRTILLTTPCTSCAASPAVVCPRGFRKTSKNSGTTGCSYMVEIGDRQVELPGCSHKCEKVTTVKRCCPDFWGPLCLPCPSWSGKTCNGYGTCGAGDSGNGTCICEEGYSGFACQNCLNKNAYGEHCRSECSCVNGQCNSGPEGNGECYCQPPYAGPKCDKISSSCSNCPAYSYCKGDVTNAVCECLPGYKKVGHACIGVCSPGICDVNADCSFSSGQFHCKCKEGFEGDGKHCIPKNPCTTQNGGCPEDSTICEYTGPGKAKCTCVPGTDSPDPSKGCRPKSACTASSCDSGARCETSSDGTVRCLCNAQQIGDGRRCYGNLMERLVELDREASHSGNLTGSIRLFEQGCEFTMSQHGPFTAFIPVGQNPFQAIAAKASASIMNTVCKNHLILGQRLYKDLEGNDLWTYGGEKVRFKAEKQFILMRDPDVLFTILESDIPASNGIIHIIDKPFTLTHIESSNNMEFSSKTIGEIFREDDRFNRFLSLVDNCGVVLPIRGSGPLTVFVPTNKAIDRSRDGSIIYMLNDAKAKLQTLLKHHMFSLAALTVDQLASMSEINTMANEILPVNVSGDGRVFLGQKGIPLETKDIVASNGIIHLIDGILVPSSIVPIMPHRCDVNESRIIVGPCVRCSYLYETQCPPGSVELENHLRGCEPNPDPRWTFSLSEMGCAKYCNTTQMRAECCSGFYGPDCRPCVGGFQHPCYDKGVCFDGIAGNGSCKCEPAFKGVACHICTDHNKHGENCDEDCRCVHGVCDNRPGSMGVCRRGSCLNDYSGELCNQLATQCDSDGAFLHCHIHAKCVYNGGQTMCACLPGYEGDGYSCTEANLCLKPDRGGCDVNAGCMYEGAGKINCVCMEGWTGDGTMCTEINNCILDSRGGCHEHAECTHTGPGQNVCSCRKGYMGDGIVCKIVNVCLTNNGGCHSLATCKMNGNGTHDCTCPNEYEGDGITCYGNMLKELDGNSEFYQFNRFLQRHTVIDSDRRVTALVPTKNAFRNLSDSEEDFWLDYYRLPHLLKVHFLDGIYTFEDLKKQVGKTVPTMGKTKWEIQSKGNELMIGNATILVPDLKAINGCIHLIDTILRPPVSDFPPPPPDLMEALNKTPSFSLFRQAALLYNLSENIPTKDYTIFVPYDSAIQEYLKKTNSTQLTQKIMKYHVILSEQLFPEHLGNGIFKNTFLGNGTQIMFYVDSQNRTMANDVPLNGSFIETRNGMLFGIPRVLDIHKNHCSKDVILKIGGRCGDCSEAPKCFYNAKPIQETYPPNMKSNCRYKTKVGKKKKFVPGCHIDCLRTTKDHSCCPGYFGHDCFKCPGTVDNWCSNNGQCQDGLHGNGECLCNEGFHGTACEMCEPGRFGKDCKSECHCEHGKCLDGMEGNGQCICFKGWKGVNCSVEIVNDACGGVCDVNANCISGGSGSPTCSCTAGYSGNGMVCTEIDPCAVNNGGCSSNANCTKTAPGERNCKCINGYTGDGVVCLETDSCLVNNGGCDKNAICLKTGPNKVACACKPGFTSLGHVCLATNPCRKNNGGCSLNAICRYIGDGERNCTCYIGYKGDGFQCAGTVSRELLRKPEAEWFRRNLGISKVRDLFSQGPFTVFLPHADYVKNLTNVESWVNKSFSPDMLRYHIVGCEELRESDLMSVKEVLTTGGHKLRFSVRDGVVYINDNTKIITSDFECSNGVIHIIDKVLFPYKLTDNMPEISTDLNVTAAAEQYGFKTFSKLLQDANLMHVVLHRPFYPFTMFWPTDSVFDSLPEERKRWLYSEDHRDKLQAYLKAHIVRDQRTVAGALPAEKKVETLYGTELTFSCNKNLIGDILINGNNARIISRNLLYDFGIAHGIDQLLEPPSIGARCDDFANTEKEGRCGSCILPPRCPLGTEDTNKTNICRRSYMPYIPRRPYGFYSYGLQYDSYRPLIGCNRICTKMEWSFKCCKNHYGRDCQVCPGGLEAPCGEHGDCDDGQMGTGKCKCHQGFRGTACELCQLNHFGPNCTACNCTTNGKCDEGIDGVGSCFCQEGWTGTHCESKIEVKPVCSPTCDLNAVCLPENQCECVPPYEGNGINCTAPDFCSEYNGGCHEQAACLQTGINVSCSCQTGYSGDGHVCSPINRCVEEANGGCSDFAECIFTGPNERRCQCLPGYVGNGVQCLEKVVPPLDRCLENNGGCDPKASCKDLHFHTKTAGVFHFRSPEGKYKLNFSQAQEACESEGGSLATFSQLSDAQQLGMHLCVAGWMDGKKAGYPIRFPSVKCGDNHVGIVVYKEPVNVSWPYDAYCYRMREVSCKCGQGYVGDGEFCNGDLASVVATTSNFSVFYTTLLKYAEDGEEGKNLLNFLSDGSSNTTIFVPHNDGFSANETLSWRDLQYHISTINNIHYFEDMKHNTVIPSRLGSDLVVIISSNSTSQAEESQPQKLVNKKVILAWNIPAINGLIHVIEAPLRAPPVHVAPVLPISQSSGVAVTTVLIIIAIVCIVTGLAYYVLKHKNDAFRFQYFKNDDEDGASRKDGGNPALVSIPNPLYSGYRAFAEPFGESAATDTPNLMD